MGFVPHQVGLTDRTVTVVNLLPNTNYTLSVEALNGVSELLPSKRFYTQVNVSTSLPGESTPTIRTWRVLEHTVPFCSRPERESGPENISVLLLSVLTSSPSGPYSFFLRGGGGGGLRTNIFPLLTRFQISEHTTVLQKTSDTPPHSHTHVALSEDIYVCCLH